jgi:glycosyltransferase involved in cell wall biosynthesis
MEVNQTVDGAGTAVMGNAQRPPFVSVVIPTRNRIHLLTDALGSLLEQDYPEDRYEIVVVDDGSTDGTAGIVDALATARQQPRMRLVRRPPKNQNAARNLGVSTARGSLVAFLDDDEVAPRNWLSGLVEGRKRHPDVDVVGGPYRVRFDAPVPRLCPRCWPGEAAFDLGREEREVEEVAGGNLLIRKAAFEAVGSFDEALQGHRNETEWMMRFRRKGGRIVYLPDVPVWHRRGRTELRLTYRLRKAYAIGRQVARYERAHTPGQQVGAVTHLASIPRAIGHAVRRGCSGGLTQAARSLGFVREGEWRPVRR